ncbi:MAG: type III pantothenate kinase [Alphaproteobacteria bacterium]|nr:type III pantothenate kinase [Alphaproteobacteria bacterium]
MLLAIDAGNTNTVFAVCKDAQTPVRVWRIKADAARTADEYAAWLLPLLQQGGLGLADITDVVIGSVVPSANLHFRKFCQTYLKKTPLFVGDAGTSHGLTILLPHPESLGADRVVNVMAATAQYKTPMIIIDFGTATKLEVIDANGAYIGGIIAPGINQSADALHMATAKLPKIDIMKPAKVTGTDTISAMRSGIFWGYVSMIEGLIRRLSDENNFKPFILVTGGLAPIFEGSIGGVDKTDEMLTIQGLQLFHARNKHVKAVA